MTRLVKLNVQSAAAQFGVSRDTLKRGLVAMGIKVGWGAKFDLRQIYRALAGDLKEERTRETRAKADLLELKRAEREKDLVPMADAEALVQSVLLPVRDIWLAMPAALAARCNPGDPELARAQLQSWVDDSIRSVQPKEEK